jgi:hypothetical protein
MVNFTLKEVALKQAILALKFFTLLIVGMFFVLFFKSIKCSGIIQGITGFLAFCIFAMVIAILFPNLRDEKDESTEGYFFAIFVILIIFISIKSYFATFFYDEFMAKVSDFLPYLGWYVLTYVLVVSIYLFSKKIKVGCAEGLIDEYKKASEQTDEEPKLFTNGSDTLPNISDLDKNITKNINIKSL